MHFLNKEPPNDALRPQPTIPWKKFLKEWVVLAVGSALWAAFFYWFQLKSSPGFRLTFFTAAKLFMVYGFVTWTVGEIIKYLYRKRFERECFETMILMVRQQPDLSARYVALVDEKTFSTKGQAGGITCKEEPVILCSYPAIFPWRKHVAPALASLLRKLPDNRTFICPAEFTVISGEVQQILRNEKCPCTFLELRHDEEPHPTSQIPGILLN